MMTFLAIAALFVCGIISALVLYHFKRRHLYEKASKFPGPSTVPVLGNSLRFIGTIEQMLEQMMKLANIYSSPYRIWLGPILVIYVSSPADIKRILSSAGLIEKPDLLRFLRPLAGNGLFSAPASIWRVHRKMIAPTFNLKILESFVEVFAAQSKILVERMASRLDGPEFEVPDYVSFCTLDIICESAMGLSLGIQTSDEHRPFTKAINRVLTIIIERGFKPWLYPDVIFRLTRNGKEQKAGIEILHRFSNDVIRKKTEALNERKNLKDGKINEEDETSERRPRRKAYLDHLMELTNDKMKFSATELREEVDTMIAAGSDTLTYVISFIMLMLASFQNVQDKVYEELCGIYGSDVDDIDDRNVTHDDLSRMEYMERVIKETMRLFPIANLVFRQAHEDFVTGEYTIPKGCTVLVDVLAVHRSPKYWKDPLEFDPDRFLPEEVAKRDPYSFLPFSAGPRNCIGLRFAMMEMKTIIATVLRRYVLKKDNPLPVRDIRLTINGVLQTSEPMKLRIIQRRGRLYSAL